MSSQKYSRRKRRSGFRDEEPQFAAVEALPNWQVSFGASAKTVAGGTCVMRRLKLGRLEGSRSSMRAPSLKPVSESVCIEPFSKLVSP